MPQYITVAYQLGCKYAMDLFEKAAGPAALIAKAPGLLQKLLGSRGAQYAAGGLGGAAFGAATGGEDNRLRGAMMGAGAGLGAVGLGRYGAGRGAQSIQNAVAKAPNEMLQKLGPEGLAKAVTTARLGAGALGAGAGLAGGATLAGGLAPAHQDPSWTSKLRGMLPF